MGIKDKLPGAAKREARKTEREKIDERREEVLSKGRKFKYPMQYSKHWLVLVTIIIAMLALIGGGIFGWLSLYRNNNDVNDVIYRITTIIPAPVASVDGKWVRYSDYLMIYHSSITPVEQQNGSIGSEEDTESIKQYYRRAALTAAEDYTYALKLAAELNINVTDEMIDKAILDHRRISGAERSEESFLRVLRDNFGLSKNEYRRMLLLSLTKAEVSKNIDSEASKKADEVESKLAANVDFPTIATELELEYEDTGDVVDLMNVDGGRAVAAYNLSDIGQTSGRIVSSSGDCYYFVKLINKTESKVHYVSIKIPFTELDKRLKDLRQNNKITEFINIHINEEKEESFVEDSSKNE